MELYSLNFIHSVNIENILERLFNLDFLFYLFFCLFRIQFSSTLKPFSDLLTYLQIVLTLSITFFHSFSPSFSHNLSLYLHLWVHFCRKRDRYPIILKIFFYFLRILFFLILFDTHIHFRTYTYNMNLKIEISQFQIPWPIFYPVVSLHSLTIIVFFLYFFSLQQGGCRVRQ